MDTRLKLAGAMLAILLAHNLKAAEVDEIRARNLTAAREWHNTMQEAAATNANWQTLPGILIDTGEPAIYFKAEATGLSPRDIVEFFLIGKRSGNAYEAIAVALAEPADIATAIGMLGLEPGQPTNLAATRFWPQGERVHVFFNQYHATELMLDERTGKPPPRSGFVYIASHQTEQEGQTHLTAQIHPPFSIASNYNEPTTILDLPVRAPQSAVYSQQVQNPAIRFDPGQLLTVRIVPERTDGTKRVKELRLHVTRTEKHSDNPAVDLRLTLEHNAPEATPLFEFATLERLILEIQKLVAEEHDPFVEIHLDDSLRLREAQSLARLIEGLEGNEGIRILPPPPGQLYYRAFIPDENMRARNDRIAHPWELHLTLTEPPTLVHIEEIWQQGVIRPQISLQEITITDTQELPAMMNALRPDMQAVFVYAPPDMPLLQMMPIIRTFQATHPMIHVFMTPEPPARTSGAVPVVTSE